MQILLIEGNGRGWSDGDVLMRLEFSINPLPSKWVFSRLNGLYFFFLSRPIIVPMDHLIPPLDISLSAGIDHRMLNQEIERSIKMLSLNTQ